MAWETVSINTEEVDNISQSEDCNEHFKYLDGTSYNNKIAEVFEGIEYDKNILSYHENDDEWTRKFVNGILEDMIELKKDLEEDTLDSRTTIYIKNVVAGSLIASYYSNILECRGQLHFDYKHSYEHENFYDAVKCFEKAYKSGIILPKHCYLYLAEYYYTKRDFDLCKKWLALHSTAVSYSIKNVSFIGAVVGLTTGIDLGLDGEPEECYKLAKYCQKKYHVLPYTKLHEETMIAFCCALTNERQAIHDLSGCYEIHIEGECVATLYEFSLEEIREEKSLHYHALAYEIVRFIYRNGPGGSKNDRYPNDTLNYLLTESSYITDDDKAFFTAKINDIISSNVDKKSGCYIATCVYGSYDCPEVWTLRRFRDFILDETVFGRLFIKLYYRISPTIVAKYGQNRMFRAFWRFALDGMVKQLRNKGISDTPYKDKY